MIFGCGKKEKLQADTEKEEKIEETAIKEKKTEKTVIKKAEEILEQEDTKAEDEEVQESQEQVVLDGLSQGLQAYIQQIEMNGGTASIYVEDLKTEAYAAVNSQQMQAASLIKLYIAGCVYEQMETMKGQESYEGETEELLHIMISVSDNDAANMLTTRLGYGDAKAGREAVNQFCQEHGYIDTYMGRMMLEFSSTEDNYTSVNDCGQFLKDIYQQKIAGSENICIYMKQQERRNKLPAGVPENIIVANKTGELADVENDVAIVYTDHRDYIICVMLSQLQDPGSGRSLITELSSFVYQSMMIY